MVQGDAASVAKGGSSGQRKPCPLARSSAPPFATTGLITQQMFPDDLSCAETLRGNRGPKDDTEPLQAGHPPVKCPQ